MRRALFAITTLLVVTGWAQEASGQCSITVLDLNGTPTLCSDYGDDWRWTGPGGFTSSAMCVDAITPGTYTLRVFDAATGLWSEPCSHTVGDPPAPPSCSIAGPDSVCAGGSVTWCAPSGDFTFAWSGPGGFVSDASCITFSEPGTYTLTLTDRASGLSSEPCSQTLRLVSCNAPEPLQNCPAPARWWASACGTTSAALAPTQMDHLADVVDRRSAVWNYGGTRAGLSDILAPARHGRAFLAARRHYAAVVANLVANDMDVVDANGRHIGLSPDVPLDQIQGVAPGTTLGAWVAATEATMLAMGESGSRERSAREKCRRIRVQAREINGGAHTTGCAGLSQTLLADDDGDDAESFGAGEGTAMVSGGGTPFSGPSRMRWTLDRAESVELDVLDLSGRRVNHLARGTYSAGTHDFTWDGRADDGQAMRPGAYFVTGRIGGVEISQRLILLR